jgi:hypothetical protein
MGKLLTFRGTGLRFSKIWKQFEQQWSKTNATEPPIIIDEVGGCCTVDLLTKWRRAKQLPFDPGSETNFEFGRLAAWQHFELGVAVNQCRQDEYDECPYCAKLSTVYQSWKQG